MDLTKKMMTPKEVSEVYGFSVGTLANKRYKKEGPKYYKVDRKVLYDVADLEAFFKSHPVHTKDSLDK